MTLFATIGSVGLYLLFAWLLSAAIGSWVSDRKGYGERVGLTFGLLLSVVGLAIVLILPGRPGSAWKLDGPLPKRRKDAAVVAVEGPAVSVSPDGAGTQSGASRGRETGPGSGGGGEAGPGAGGDAPPPAR